MRLILNKLAADNITDLFPTDWQPRPKVSSVQEKHYKVLTEVMIDMLIQCGLLIETETIEKDNYQDFLEVLHHHTFMGNVFTTQLTHFIMLMTYISFSRISHYTEYMDDRGAVQLKSAVWMSLVVMSFKTTFSMKGSHNTINPYFKNLPTIVRRNLIVLTIRYMDQDCTCLNHVQCDLYLTRVTSDVVLPSYLFLSAISSTVRNDQEEFL